jgi:hypothetical protein
MNKSPVFISCMYQILSNIHNPTGSPCTLALQELTKMASLLYLIYAVHKLTLQNNLQITSVNNSMLAC